MHGAPPLRRLHRSRRPAARRDVSGGSGVARGSRPNARQDHCAAFQSGSPPCEQASRISITPDQPGRIRRVGTGGQRLDPPARRPGESRREDLRIASNELPVTPRVANDPAARDSIGLLAPDGDRVALGLGDLPRRRPRARTNVTHRVPALDQPEPSSSIVPEADIGRAPRLARPRRELERSAEPCRPPEPEDELLHRQVTGVRRVLERVSLQLHDERPPDGQRHALPGVEALCPTQPPLEVADGRSRDPGGVGDLLLRPPTPNPGISKLAAESRQLLEVSAPRIRTQLRRPLQPLHVMWSVTTRSSLALTPDMYLAATAPRQPQLAR